MSGGSSRGVRDFWNIAISADILTPEKPLENGILSATAEIRFQSWDCITTTTIFAAVQIANAIPKFFRMIGSESRES